MRKLGKREFLKLMTVGMAAASGPTASPAFGQMGHMRHGAAIARPDPQPGDLFRDPAWAKVQEVAPGLLQLDLEARRTSITVNGTTANLFTYNGFYPAPTIRVKAGDILRIHFKNGLPEMGENILGHRRMTNLHTHGFHVSPMGNSDNVMLEFGPGDTFHYEYNLAKQYPGMLALYHPHYHGSVAEQYWGGMCGAILIEDDTPRLADYETHLVVLKDITL
ncbi:MAG: multicopper oxidase family protein, partial [Acidobacteria bacterium]